ncbi:MAG: hypothetical protein M5U19_18045 [Microthrixaceae bacterium]|nr:hypothetical protein [Microthrixaceae bacterium]
MEEIASEEKTARPIVLVMRWCSSSSVESGDPIRTRFNVDAMEPSWCQASSGAKPLYDILSVPCRAPGK